MIILVIALSSFTYLLGFITATIKLMKSQPKEDHKIVELHNLEWFVIMQALQQEEQEMYSRLVSKFTDEQMEEIYDTAILEDIIFRTNNNLEHE